MGINTIITKKNLKKKRFNVSKHSKTFFLSYHQILHTKKMFTPKIFKKKVKCYNCLIKEAPLKYKF